MTETRVARARGRAVASAIALVLVMGPTAATVVPAAAVDQSAPPVFSPMASTSLGLGTVLGSVVADGTGVMHNVVRSDQGIQQLLYRRSTDGGSTWRLAGRFTGPQGATDPVLAAQGNRVLLGFRSIWCRTPFECAESLYVASSEDGGDTWVPPRRIATSAYGLMVAVDEERSWAAWTDYTGQARVRAWRSDPGSPVITGAYPGRAWALAAADGVMGLAVWRFRGSVVVVGAEDDHGTLVLRDPVAVPEALEPVHGEDRIAAAAGQVHLLLARPVSPTAPRAERRLFVWTGGDEGTFADPVPVMTALRRGRPGHAPRCRRRCPSGVRPTARP